MNRLKRCKWSAVAAGVAVSFPHLSVAATLENTGRVVVTGESVRMAVASVTGAGFAEGRVQVVSITSSGVLFRATLLAGATDEHAVLFAGLDASGGLVPDCLAIVNGPVPTPAAEVLCATTAIRFDLAVSDTFPVED
jgi:hypothetical protein